MALFTSADLPSSSGYKTGFSGIAPTGSTESVFGKSAMSELWKTIGVASGGTGLNMAKAEYRQFTSKGGRYTGASAIPTFGAEVIPVIATTTGLAPKNLWERMGAPAGVTVRNPSEVVRNYGITSTYRQGVGDPTRLKLFGRLGLTRGHTLMLHPELYKPLGPRNLMVSRGLSMVSARTEPPLGTPEGMRYWNTLRKEVAGAEMVYDPSSMQWGSRNAMRWQLNAMLTPGTVENEAMLTGVSMRRIKESRERAAAQAMFKGYSPDLSWILRVKPGSYTESGPTLDNMPATIRTYEGTQNIGETTVKED